MLVTEVYALLESKKTGWKFKVQGEDRNFQIEAVSEIFLDMSRLKRQQAVYRLISEEITNGLLHAITITALTPGEKQNRQGLDI